MQMVGIWCLVAWMHLGRPARLRLVELGPGRGTLIADLLRGAAAFLDFRAALEVELVELSPALRRAQWAALKCRGAPPAAAAAAAEGIGSGSIGSGSSGSGSSGSGSSGSGSGGAARVDEMAGVAMVGAEGDEASSGVPVRWRGSLEEVPGGAGEPPAVYLAHEFFDALPVHQFVRAGGGGGGGGGGKGGGGGGLLDASGNVVGSGTGSGGGGGGLIVDAYGEAAAGGSAAAASTAAAAEGRWLEKMVDVAADGDPGPHHLRFVLSPRPTPAAALLVPRRLAALPEAERARVDAIEISAQGMAAAERLAQRVGAHGGAALVIDYGRAAPPYADSLVAIRGHKGVHPLSSPGAADLSAWVDFGALRAAAEGSGAAVEVLGPVPQADLLHALGLQARAQALAAAAQSEAQVEALRAAYERLVGAGPEGMGQTYQAMAIVARGMPAPVGFGGGAGEEEEQQQGAGGGGGGGSAGNGAAGT